MHRRFDTASAALALAFVLLAASSAFAQVVERRVGPAVRLPAELRPAALGCCKCLGGTNTLDLSTVPSNRWTVNGGPAAFLSSIHPLWNINPGPASWVSTVATGGTGGVAAGVYEYRLDFAVPACTIGQEVTLSGNVGGDDDFDVFIDSVNGTSISQCAGWCFNTPNNTLHTFTIPVTSGTHTLIVRVKNGGGPSGMFVNAKLTGACRAD
ncbi:MAG TPA: hypothetical protein VM936_22475 [Pyrinomonadaceae bacterium]|nr:hypothetical protein [Pyrinomonadaceae bacterium]